MNFERIEAIAAELELARVECRTVPPLSEFQPDMTVAEAYAVQHAQTARRLATGVRMVGKKVGLTSKTVQNMLGVHQPDFGCLFSDMAVASGSTIDIASLIQPKIEGEIAFVLKEDLRGPGLTAADVLRATHGVMACFEIVDSRIADWKIGIADTVADNASSAMFVLGDRLVDAGGLELALCGMVMERNGEIVVTGAGAAALGSPVNAVVWLANMLGELDVPLLKGEVILSGALGPMVTVATGEHYRLTIGGLGSCSVRFS